MGYINAAIQDRSPEMLLLALRDVAEAHKMSKVAKATGVAREAIYRILSQKGNPRLSSLWNLFPTLGLELFVRPGVRASGSKRKSRTRRQQLVSQTNIKLHQQMQLAFGDAVTTREAVTPAPYFAPPARTEVITIYHPPANIPPAWVINSMLTSEVKPYALKAH